MNLYGVLAWLTKSCFPQGSLHYDTNHFNVEGDTEIGRELDLKFRRTYRDYSLQVINMHKSRNCLRYHQVQQRISTVGLRIQGLNRQDDFDSNVLLS